jgi:transposase InsO family protein
MERKFRTFNLIDDFNREVLALEADTSLPAKRVVRVLERVIWEKGSLNPIHNLLHRLQISFAYNCIK